MGNVLKQNKNIVLFLALWSLLVACMLLNVFHYLFLEKKNIFCEREREKKVRVVAKRRVIIIVLVSDKQTN